MRLEDRREILFDGPTTLNPSPFVVDHLSFGGEQRGNRLGISAVVCLDQPRDHVAYRPFVVVAPWSRSGRGRGPLGGRWRRGLCAWFGRVRRPRFGVRQQQPRHAQQRKHNKQEDRSHGQSPYFPKRFPVPPHPRGTPRPPATQF
jgi:hypothetical protein